MSLARPLAAAALIAGAFLGGTASANCTGTANTAGVCTANRTVYEDCVYLASGTCTPVSVQGPVCVYGWIGPNLQYITSFC